MQNEGFRETHAAEAGEAHRVLRLAIVEGRIPPQFVEWVGPMIATRGTLGALPRDLAVRILDGSPDAVLICDRTGIVRYWNAAAERVFGFSMTEALGASMNLIIPERLRVRHWAGWEAAMTTGVTRYDDGQLLAVPALHKNGRQISIEFSIQFLKDADGQIEWVIAIVRDVTERFLREKDLRVQLKAVQRHSTGQP